MAPAELDAANERTAHGTAFTVAPSSYPLPATTWPAAWPAATG